MKATELRIGNFVKNHGESGEIYRVTEIRDNGFTAGPMTVYPAGMEFDYGVALTEEWLLKFGFMDSKRVAPACQISIGQGCFLHWDSIGDDVYLSGEGMDDVLYFDCEYVHQLQNLYFALTCEELFHPHSKAQ